MQGLAGWGYPGNCGKLTPGTYYERRGHTGDWGHVIPLTESGKGVTLEPVDLWSQVQCLGCDITQETVDMWPQVQDFGWVTLETVDMWLQGECLQGSHLGESVCVTPGTGSGSWGNPGDCAHVTPGTASGEGCHSGHHERVTPGAGSEIWGHPGNRGQVNWGTKFGEVGSYWRLWMCNPNFRVWEGCHPGIYGCVISGRRGESYWRLWPRDPRCSTWDMGSHWRLWTGETRCVNTEGLHPGERGCVNLLQGLWRVSLWRMWKSDRRAPLELQWGIWVSSRVAAGNSGFLLSCSPLVVAGTQCSSPIAVWNSGVVGNLGSSWVGGLLRVLLHLWWGILSNFLGAIHL